MPPSDTTPHAILIIGGSDSSNGAGIGRDIQTAHRHDITPLVAITAVTAQTHDALIHQENMPLDSVTAQVRAAFESDCHRIAAIKIGLIPHAAMLRAIANQLSQIHVPVVMDPVMSTSSGSHLHNDTPSFVDAVNQVMPPLVTLLTPNRHEAALLTGDTDDAIMEKKLSSQGWHNVLITDGNHEGEILCDCLVRHDGQRHEWQHERIHTSRATIRGTGCRLATAIAIRLALGDSLTNSIDRSRRWLLDCLRSVPPHANPV